MKVFILIVWLAASGKDARSGITLDHIEFPTQKLCKDAFAAMKDVSQGEMYLRGVCVPANEEAANAQN